jgi:Asp-tRNA(Asn)/Glu-tRNA(Gln) amidotransferase A subunit family amidase
MIHPIETRLGPLARGLRSGQIDLQRYLEQLEAYFTPENERVRAFLPEAGRFERLRFEAAALEVRYPDPALRPPLYGVPVGVKDIFHVDGFPTQAGARLPATILAGLEAESVGRLKQAGALIMGKTVTTEFAYFGPGPTRNPHNLEHTPGGSSSGSAAAVGAGLCPLALGSQTIGSVIRPAAFCGTVGFKPSFGRISNQGVIPISASLDHIGFFTRDVAGAALAASVLCADWQPEALASVRPALGIPTGPYLDKAGAEALEHFGATVNKLEQAGFIVHRIEALSDFDEIVAWHNDLMAGEMARVHEDWFGRYGQWYHPKTAALIERGHQVSMAQIRVYAAGRERLRHDLQALMREHDISLWIAPSAVGPAPHGLGSTGDPIMNLPWTNAGLPTINLPAGLARNGLPLGLQLAGGWQKDEQLFAWAEQIAAALGVGNQ